MSSGSDKYIENIQFLLENGCTESDAIRLLSEYPDVDTALEKFWEEQFGAFDNNGPTPETSFDVFGSSSDDDSDDDLELKILQLMNMGYPRDICESALISAGNDILLAVQILSVNPVDSVSAENKTADIEEQKHSSGPRRRQRVGGPRRSLSKVYHSSDSEGEESLLLTASEEDGKIEFLIDTESISRVIWSVSKYSLPLWCRSYYDNKMPGLIFYVSGLVESSFIHLDGNRVSMDIRLFTSERSLSEAESFGIYFTVAAAEYVPSLRVRRDLAHARARSAYEGLRPEGGEWKNDYESLPSVTLGDTMISIREALEFRLRDVSTRVVKARRVGISEIKLMRFSRAAFEYITCSLDISLIRLRVSKKTADASFWTRTKERARKEGWTSSQWRKFFESSFNLPQTRILRQRSADKIRPKRAIIRRQNSN